jgi:DNA-directed RNA polymerase subunit RPC12/RpoP
MGYHDVKTAGNRRVSCDECGREFLVNPPLDGVTACPRCGHKNAIKQKKRDIGELKSKYDGGMGSRGKVSPGHL